MGLTGTLLRSRTVAALTSPHGVDRYLEQINPMWAAHEVRAMTSFATTADDVDRFAEGVAVIAARHL